VLQPSFHNFKSIKGDILVIGHYNQQPRNVTLKDYRNFQQVVIPVEGEPPKIFMEVILFKGLKVGKP
jgi:hypothetical protein